MWEIIGQADGGLSVLRTFRLLRVLKLVRFMPALRRQLVVLIQARLPHSRSLLLPGRER